MEKNQIAVGEKSNTDPFLTPVAGDEEKEEADNNGDAISE